MNSILLNAEEALKNRRYKEALSLFRKALDLDRENTNALLGAADCLYNLQKNDEAKIVCNEALSIDHNLILPYIILSYLEENLVASREQAEIALRLGPNSPAALCCYGILLGREGKPDEAIKYFLGATQIDKNFYLAQFNLYVCYQNIGSMRDQYQQSKILLRLRTNLRNLTTSIGLYLGLHRFFHVGLILLPVLYIIRSIEIFFLPHIFLIWLHASAIIMSAGSKQWSSFRRNIILTIWILFIDILTLAVVATN